MLFNVKYRDKKTGRRESLLLEAGSKAEIWPILNERGINAISICEVEGKYCKTKKKNLAGVSTSSKFRVLAIAVIALAGIGGAAWWLFSSGDKTVQQEVVAENNKKIKDSSPKVSKPSPKKIKVEEKVEEVNPAKRRVETLSFVTNSMGMIVERYKTADGKTHKLIRPSKPPLFKHMTDDLISMAMCTSGGGQMPPLPLSGNLDKEFLESLNDPIVINDDDPEDIKERKRIVAETRKEIDELMKQGISFRSILADHEKVFNANAAIRAEAKAELRKICEEGDAEGVQKYLDTINAAFQEMGIEELKLPKSREERRAEMEARRAAREEASKQKGNK